MKEALLYKQLLNKHVSCFLCSHFCNISDKQFGICRVRQNIDGKLYSLVYGKIISANVDPIEKKPLFHFLPGSKAFSIATIGCNFQCGFCQNWQISQYSRENTDIPGEDFTPQEIVRQAKSHGCKSISYTYTEPTIFFEFAFDTAKIAKENGLRNNFVTNGYMTKEALYEIHPFLDAANVDLKAFSDDFYQKVCKAKLQPVLDSIRLMRKLGIWVEITTLVIPKSNDSKRELADIAGFIASVDKNIPWHISRFHPDYKYGDSEPTPLETLVLAREIGLKQGLRYVYVGNVWSDDLENTYCWKCDKMLLKRRGFEVLDNKLTNSKCSYCKSPIEGIWQ